MTPQKVYDVAIIGSGIGGSTLACVLARQGLSVIVFEGGTHPRFTIGESMILETSEVMRALAEFYDVPELAYFSSENFFPLIGAAHGVKRHFSFVHHRAGESQNPRHALQAVIPKLPYGHEIHIHRQDADYFLTSVAISYGATVHQATPVRSVAIDEAGVTLSTERGEFRAGYLVDAGGMRSLLADQLGWRHRDLRTHSRTLFTHMIDVPCFNEVGPSRKDYGFPFPLSQGTLHHIFHGGWLWVIPFNNHPGATNPLCSVGLQLDPRIYPPQPDLPPEREFFDFVARFPDLAAQLAHAKPVRAWTRLDRLQYGSARVVGDRFALLAHAVGFIDPLYSKGLYVTHMSILVLADLLLKAKHTGDYSADAFRPLETLTLRYIDMHDRLVANSYKSWSHPKLWAVYSVNWLVGAYLEYLKLTITRLRARDRADYFAKLGDLRMVGGGFAPFQRLQERIDGALEAVDPRDEVDVDRTVAEIRAAFADFHWLSEPFLNLLDGRKNHLPNNKLAKQLFNPRNGFLGDAEYRAHFFGDADLGRLALAGWRDLRRYSSGALAKTPRRHSGQSND